MQLLTDILNTCQWRGDILHAEVDESWQQGRSLYGGVQANLALQAMQSLAANLPIRTLQATLCAPVPTGPVKVKVRLLREGANTRHIEASITDQAQVLALFVGVFGKSRQSAVAHDLTLPASAGDSGIKMPFIPGAMPEFLQHFEAHLIEGHFPGAGHPDTRLVYRLGLNDSSDQAELAQVLAFADFPPPIGLSWLNRPTPGSTMTWMLNFTGHGFAGQGLRNWVVDVQLDAAQHGYLQQTVTLFAPDGYAILRGTQCMVIFG